MATQHSIHTYPGRTVEPWPDAHVIDTTRAVLLELKIGVNVVQVFFHLDPRSDLTLADKVIESFAGGLSGAAARMAHDAAARRLERERELMKEPV